MSADAAEHKLPAYVYEAPVRIWHWVMAVAMVALFVTGYFIGAPLPSAQGEAIDHYLMGWIRFVHFAAGYVFAIFFLMRVYWAFVGNHHARQIFIVPLLMLKPSFWDGVIHQTLYYLFIHREARPVIGHNNVAVLAMFFMYVLGTVFMILTGFALYGEGTGMGTWQYDWVYEPLLPLFGDSMRLHTLHHLGMYYLMMFTAVHLYMAVREDICAEATMISTMVNGWRAGKPM